MKKVENYSGYDVVVVGGGPAGLSSAIMLKRLGVKKVLVLERESECGGATRHCGHPPFGILEFHRIVTGPTYAHRLSQEAKDAGITILLRATVTQLREGPCLSVTTSDWIGEIRPKRVLLATGTRETPRGARLVSGERLPGILTTGALQAMYYLKGIVPFSAPAIIGSEVVSFSALMTCRKAGIRPVTMIEENSSPTVPWPFFHFSKVMGTRLYTGAKILEICGTKRVEFIRIQQKNGKESKIACDGALFTGKFTPEASLARLSHLEMNFDTGEPATDNYNRCSDPAYYAAGNLRQPVKTAMNCWREGRRTATYISEDLKGNPPSAITI